MRRRVFIGFALLALSYLAFANISSALAQAGNAGGTIGKQDKSISGGQRQAPMHPHAGTKKSTERSHCKLESVWSNQVSGVGSSVWTISSTGEAVEQGMGGAQGRSTMSGRNLTITWHTGLNNGTYVIQLDQTCAAGSGKLLILGGWGAGSFYTSTFTSTRSSAN